MSVESAVLKKRNIFGREELSEREVTDCRMLVKKAHTVYVCTIWPMCLWSSSILISFLPNILFLLFSSSLPYLFFLLTSTALSMDETGMRTGVSYEAVIPLTVFIYYYFCNSQHLNYSEMYTIFKHMNRNFSSPLDNWVHWKYGKRA